MTQNNIQRSLGRIEEAISFIKDDLKSLREVSEHKIEDLGSRVHKVEKKQYAILAVASLAFTITVGYVKKFF